MLGWRITIHRGGRVRLNASGYDFEVVGGTEILRTGDIQDICIIEPLAIVHQQGRAERYGSGYPLVWKIAARDIQDFLTRLDSRPLRFMDDSTRDARGLLQRLGIEESETLLVEAWDQS